MSLKTVVKVGNISNLSDARYCSGMGVDMLGFCVIAGKTNYMSPELYQQIRGWIPGPKIVAEIYGLQSPESLSDIIKQYAPDYFEMHEEEYKKYQNYLSIPSIVSVAGDTGSHFKNISGIAYLILSDHNVSSIGTVDQEVLLQTNSKNNILEKLSHYHLTGVAINSSPDDSATIDKFDGLADILEMLDE